MSVKEMTPVSLPEIRAPGNAAAETTGNELDREGDAGTEVGGEAMTA